MASIVWSRLQDGGNVPVDSAGLVAWVLFVLALQSLVVVRWKEEKEVYSVRTRASTTYYSRARFPPLGIATAAHTAEPDSSASASPQYEYDSIWVTRDPDDPDVFAEHKNPEHGHLTNDPIAFIATFESPVWSQPERLASPKICSAEAHSAAATLTFIQPYWWMFVPTDQWEDAPLTGWGKPSTTQEIRRLSQSSPLPIVMVSLSQRRRALKATPYSSGPQILPSHNPCIIGSANG
ncbi:hypothetical protein BOTBODRAFT_643513 [Botryobasidium botryosum FD-172 SS1]|uniref:Uncharacterized protein n=1 Tax=Botryobasidium botryosum (strain FD-172 SS1) TaxID=930990 RepID=A0A067M0D2_BOTB1|nr:hypothetical protein BOTBODRAFT_643513 [Botryobasidium botryosum FD-172 SS1]